VFWLESVTDNKGLYTFRENSLLIHGWPAMFSSPWIYVYSLKKLHQKQLWTKSKFVKCTSHNISANARCYMTLLYNRMAQKVSHYQVSLLDRIETATKIWIFRDFPIVAARAWNSLPPRVLAALSRWHTLTRFNTIFLGWGHPVYDSYMTVMGNI